MTPMPNTGEDSELREAKHILLSLDMLSDYKSRLELVLHLLEMHRLDVLHARTEELERLKYDEYQTPRFTWHDIQDRRAALKTQRQPAQLNKEHAEKA